MDTRELIFNIMLLASCAVMTLGVIGILRMPDIYTKLHGSSKAVFLGIVTLCIASSVLATPAMNMRLILIALVTVLTTPISAHAIGRSAWLLHEQMQTPGAVDESHTLTPEAEEPTWRL
ncbi:MAG: monovalent cation/H(+) antiporter subunit G [Thermomicrobiales bacterium]|nr:monovalent cation/H(+) antiporter subunit G [Thermomicrobiales bacterium]